MLDVPRKIEAMIGEECKIEIRISRMLMYHYEIVQVPHTLVTHPSVVGPRRMSAACRFTFTMQYRNFTKRFCQPDRFLFQLCVIYSSATRLLHPSVVPPRRVISGADYGTMLRRARLIRAPRKQPGVCMYTPDAPPESERSRGFYGLGENDATVDNDRH